MYVTVTTDTDTFHEFWVEDDHKWNLLASLGLLSNNLDISEALALADTCG